MGSIAAGGLGPQMALSRFSSGMGQIRFHVAAVHDKIAESYCHVPTKDLMVVLMVHREFVTVAHCR